MSVKCSTTTCKCNPKHFLRLCGEEKYIYYCDSCLEILKSKLCICDMCNELSMEPSQCILKITGLKRKELIDYAPPGLRTSLRRRQRGQY